MLASAIALEKERKMNYSTKNKMQKLSTVILPVVGIILMIAALASVWFWESYGREMYLYRQIIVASEEIKEGTVINKEMLGIMKIEKSKVINGAVEEPEKVLGKAARCYIPKLAQIHDSYLITKDLVNDKDHFITPIPKEWIKAIPNSLRRQDTAYICFVDNSLFSSSDTISKNDKIVLKPDGDSIQIYNEEKEKIPTLSDAPEIKTKIAYVKDGANREVVTLSTQERYDGTAAISEVSANLTRDEFKIMEQQVSKGRRIVIKYKEVEKGSEENEAGAGK